MIKNFHSKILLGVAIYAFVQCFVFLSSGLQSKTDSISIPIAGRFSAVGFFAAITAGAISSINRRLDHAGIPQDPKHLTSTSETGKHAEHDARGNGR